MNFLDTISTAFQSKAPPNSAKIAEMIEQAKSEAEAARTRLADLEGQRQDKALAGEKERTEYRAALNGARDYLASTEDAIEAITRKHEVAVAVEAEAERRKIYKAASAKAAELAGLIDDYAKHAQAIRNTVSKITEIDTVVVKANADLPAGVARLQDSGTLRSTPPAAREVISEKMVELWCREGSREPIPMEFQTTVIREANGRGFTHPESARQPIRHEMRRFVRREFLPATPTIASVALDRITLPDAFAGKLERSVQIEFELVPAA